VKLDDFGVRALAGAELALGGIALALSNAAIALCVALSYLGFGAVVLVALNRDLPIDSCGCLGRWETPPGVRHVLVAVIAFLGAFGQALDPSDALLERVGDDGVAGLVFALGAVMLAALGVVLFRAGRRPSVPR
jgi:hypothetical protein